MLRAYFPILTLGFLSLSACRSLSDESSILSLARLGHRLELDLQILSLDVGPPRVDPLFPQSQHLQQLSLIVRNTSPDLVGILQLSPDHHPELLKQLPRYAMAPQDPFAAAAQGHPLLLYRRDRFEADSSKSGKQFRNSHTKAQYLLEKATGKSLYVGQAAGGQPEAAVDRSEEMLQHMEQHRSASDMLVLMGRWSAPTRVPPEGKWLEAFGQIYRGRELNARLEAKGPREDLVYCERGACDVLGAEIIQFGAPAAYTFASWPQLVHLRLYGNKPDPAWRLAEGLLEGF